MMMERLRGGPWKKVESESGWEAGVAATQTAVGGPGRGGREGPRQASPLTGQPCLGKGPGALDTEEI